MKYNWTPLKAELAIWRAEGHHLPLWWRDDDAIAPTPALDQLSRLSTALDLPVHLAIIPKFASGALADFCSDAPHFVPLVHGWAHANQTRDGGKKAEFGAPRTDAVTELTAGLDRMQDLFGRRLLNMFVPPWNRISADLATELPVLGYEALSTFKPRTHRFAAPGMVQINCHIDPIFWRGGGGLLEPETLIADIVKLLQDRRAGRADLAEPLGFLTHHLVHDADVWDFTKACLKTLLDGGAIPTNLAALRRDFP